MKLKTINVLAGQNHTMYRDTIKIPADCVWVKSKQTWEGYTCISGHYVYWTIIKGLTLAQRDELREVISKSYIKVWYWLSETIIMINEIQECPELELVELNQYIKDLGWDNMVFVRTSGDSVTNVYKIHEFVAPNYMLVSLINFGKDISSEVAIREFNRIFENSADAYQKHYKVFRITDRDRAEAWWSSAKQRLLAYIDYEPSKDTPGCVYKAEPKELNPEEWAIVKTFEEIGFTKEQIEEHLRKGQTESIINSQFSSDILLTR